MIENPEQKEQTEFLKATGAHKIIAKLRFPAEVEARFQDDYFDKSIFQVRVALLLAAFAYSILYVLDFWITPELVYKTFIIRFLIVIPVIALIFVISYASHFKKFMQNYMTVAGIMVGLGSILLMGVVGPPASYLYFASLIIIVMALFSLARLRFFYATGTSFALFFIYLYMMAFVNHTPIPILINNGSLFFFAIIIGMISAYFMEVGLRREFYLTAELQSKTVEAVKANRELKKLSCTDALTGMANRRGLEEFLKREWKWAVRKKLSLSLIMADIDFFKKYNDSYGHQAGDECLKRLAQCLSQIATRPGDIVSRYGGEEFLIVLADTTEHNAETVAEKARKKIESLEMKHEQSEVSTYVTISMGVATVVPDLESSQKTLIEAADNSLYMAKQNGRNKIMVSGKLQKANNPITEKRD